MVFQPARASVPRTARKKKKEEARPPHAATGADAGAQQDDDAATRIRSRRPTHSPRGGAAPECRLSAFPSKHVELIPHRPLRRANQPRPGPPVVVGLGGRRRVGFRRLEDICRRPRRETRV